VPLHHLDRRLPLPVVAVRVGARPHPHSGKEGPGEGGPSSGAHQGRWPLLGPSWKAREKAAGWLPLPPSAGKLDPPPLVVRSGALAAGMGRDAGDGGRQSAAKKEGMGWEVRSPAKFDKRASKKLRRRVVNIDPISKQPQEEQNGGPHTLDIEPQRI